MNELYIILSIVAGVVVVVGGGYFFWMKKSAQAKKIAEEEKRKELEAEKEAKEKAEKEAKEKAEKEAKEKAEKEAKEKAEKEGKEKAEKEAKEKAEKEAKAKAEKEAKAKAEKEAKEKAEKEGKEKAERKAKEKAEKEAKAKAEREAKAKAEREAKAKAEREAKAKAEREAKAKAEKEAKEKAEREAKEKAEREAKAKAEREAKAKAEKEAKEKAEREAKAKAEKEAKEKAEREAKEKAEREAKAKAEKEAKEKKTFKEGLKKTKKGFFGKIKSLFSSKVELDEDLMDDLEELLLTSDLGPVTADHLFEKIQDGMDKKSIKNSEAVMTFLKEETYKILDIEYKDNSKQKPYIILFIGVNGSGKTTTIGKLASQYKNQGKKVLLIAGDTFRAAAVEQLKVWADRSKALFHSGKDKQDPSSVIYDGIKKGVEEKADIIIADTSGRLHTDKKLMEELKKIKRSINKAHLGAPHDTYLVLDSTNGQNAIHQAKFFHQAMDISGIVLTKLDGTAKGGVIIGICNTYKIPVRYVGIGEGINDLREMDVKEFVDALYSNE